MTELNINQALIMIGELTVKERLAQDRATALFQQNTELLLRLEATQNLALKKGITFEDIEDEFMRIMTGREMTNEGGADDE